MANISSIEDINNIRNKTNDFIRIYDKKREKWIKTTFVYDFHEYTFIIQSKKWKELNSYTEKEIKKSLDFIKEISSSQGDLRKLYEELNLSSNELNKLPGSVTQRKDWSKTRSDIILYLQKKGRKQESIDKIIHEFEKMTGKSMMLSIKERVSKRIEELNKLFFYHLRNISTAYFGKTLATFNLEIKHKNDTYDPEWLKSTENNIQKKEKELWAALRDKQFNKIVNQADELASWATLNLNEAAVQAAILASKHGKNIKADPDVDFVSLRIGNIIRSLIHAITLGYYVSWLGKWDISSSKTVEWVNAASKLPYINQSPKGCVTVSQFLNSSHPDNSEVCIEGKIKSVDIKHIGKKKAVSSAELSDNKNNMVKIAIPYIKLDSTGMVPGSFVKVNGTFNKNIEWLNNGDAIVIKRKKYTELKKESWNNWIIANLREAFDPVPNGLSTEWSWESGLNGAGNPLRYGVSYKMNSKGDDKYG